MEMNIMNLKNLVFFTAFIVVSAHSVGSTNIQKSAQADEVVGILLEPANCDLHLSGINIKRARAFGHRADLVRFLDKAWKQSTNSVACKHCPCLLVANVGECVLHKSIRVAADGYRNIPPGRIIIVIEDAGEFAKSYKSSLNSAGQPNSSCPTSELCLNSKGEASFSLECEGYGFEVSTSGQVKVTLKDVTIPVIKGQ